MSFRLNPAGEQQLSLFDSYMNLTDREKRFLNKSWAKYFADNIFPRIDEKPYAVLYSDKDSRPGTPVNIILSALIIKEYLGFSDDDILTSLMFDIRLQVAMHTTSFMEQPLSDRTLGRFRQRCAVYLEETGIDLIKNTVESISGEMAEMMKLDQSLRRMDSLMVESNIKKMTRLELLYTCVSNLAKELTNDKITLPEELLHYTKENDRNLVVYHNKSEETSSKIETILKDACTLKSLCGSSYDDSSNYQLLLRVLKEQAVEQEDGNYRLRKKEDGGMNSEILQNPSDPDATFRDKAGKQHRGYVANVTECCGENGSLVTNYQYEQNNHSDSEFLEDAINEMGPQEETVTIATDGAYSSEKNEELAAQNNIKLVATNLTGRKADDIAADFEFNEEGTKVMKCPAGHAPKSCSYNKKNGQCTVSFYREHCENCPHRKECHVHEHKRVFRRTISLKSKHRAHQQRYRSSEEFSKYSRFRNGVETIPSILRRKYGIDHMPVRGLNRTKQLFGIKIAALNITKFCKFMQERDKCALLPVNA